MGLRSLKLLLEEIPPIINCWLQSFNLPSGSGPSGQEQKLRQDKQNISGQAIPDTGVLNDIRMVGMHINRAWELIIRTNMNLYEKRLSLALLQSSLVSPNICGNRSNRPLDQSYLDALNNTISRS